MKKMKKLAALVMVMTMVFGATSTALAAKWQKSDLGTTTNGVVQTQNVATSNEQYPLAGMLEHLGLTYTGVAGWTDLDGWESNLENGSRLRADGKYYYTNYGFGGLYAFACALSGETYQNDIFGRTDPIEVIAEQNGVSYAEGQQMVTIVRDFLNSFDWKNASDEVKAQKAAEFVTNDANFSQESGYSYISGVLLYKLGACNHYAAAYQLVTRLMGMDSLHVHYTASHQWNYIKINGQWKRFDPSEVAMYHAGISFMNIPASEPSTVTIYGLGNVSLTDFLN